MIDRCRQAMALVACGAAAACMSSIGTSLPKNSSGSPDPIRHVVIIVQENRSLDNLFARFPGVDGATFGYYLKPSGKTFVKTRVTLRERPLAGGLDINHASQAYNDACDGKDTYPKTSCSMDGFNLEGIDGQNYAGTYPYQYIDPKDIAQYWSFAKNYGIGDRLFQTQGSGSFTAHQDLVAGGSNVDDEHCGSTKACALIDYPSNLTDWGCGATSEAVTSLLTKSGKYEPNLGPFPCLHYPTPTMRDLMDAKNVSWKYYSPPYGGRIVGTLWNAFAAIAAVYNGPEWKTNVSMPECTIFADISNGRLPEVSWVVPEQQNSDHPAGPGSLDHGPQWVGAVVDAIGKSRYWNSTAVAITWDDWGGFYDHASPAFFDDMGGLGFRVPLIVVSPYVRKGEISHTQYEFASILKFVEDTFALGSMGTTDVRATSIGGMFDYTIEPRPFIRVPAPPSNSFCNDRQAELEPVDRQ